MIDRRVATEPTIPGILAVMVTVMVALAALTPYLVVIPESNQNLITQAQTTLWNGWLVVLSYYFGTTQGQGKKDAAIHTLAETASKQAAAITPPPATVELGPGEEARVKAEEPKP